MKSGNRKNTGSNQNKKFAVETLEDRRMLATVETGFSVYTPDMGLSPEIRTAFERVSDLTQYTSRELQYSDWVLHLADGTTPSQIESALKLSPKYLSPTGFIEDTWLLEQTSTGSISNVISTLENNPAVEYFYPLVHQDRQPLFTPDDRLFEYQWHLNNTGQTGGTEGEDVNVLNVWENFTGEGVVIGVIDDGLDPSHPDLNYRADLAYDFVDNDSDPTPPDTSSHGTAVAGVAAAIGNNEIGVVGSAWEAEVTGIRYLGDTLYTDLLDANVLNHQADVIDISNNSWGPTGPYGGLGPLAVAAIQTNTTADGGMIYVFANGNSLQEGLDSNYFSTTNLPTTLSVTAINDEGQQSYYANPGANIFVAAHSNLPGIVTTDNVGDAGDTQYTGDPDLPIDPDDPSNYQYEFGGTSSASPLVSGVIALMLEANPELGYRDIQHIFAETARMNDPDDDGWRVNGGGYEVSHKYGFGAVDAEAAVERAITWQPLDDAVTITSGTIDLDLDIPDGNLLGTQFSINVPTTTTDGVDLTDLSIEQVQLSLDIDHTYRGDLRIVLTSPDGTNSVLSEPHAADAGGILWTYNSTQHWGESMVGLWTLTVSDEVAGDIGTIDSAQFTFIGNGADTGGGIVITPPSDRGVITGTIFDDVNENGLYDDNENGLAGQVAFLDENNNGLFDEGEPSSVTGDSGAYYFTQLPIGTYTVGYVCNYIPGRVNIADATLSATIGLTYLSTDNDFASSEDCLPTTGGGGGGGGDDRSTIEGIVFNDIDEDGVQDLNEEGVPGMTIYADLNQNCIIGEGEPAAVTDSSGRYYLAVTEGTHFIRMVPYPGAQLSPCQGQLVSAPGNITTTHNIGFAADDQYDHADNGSARHGIYPGLNLGNLISADPTVDDNDGVVFTTGLHPGATEEVVVLANKLAVSTAYLQGWIDWNGNGAYEADEQIFKDVLLRQGVNRLEVEVPLNADGSASGLFRYGFERGMNATRDALAGEAESYTYTIPSDGMTGINAQPDTASTIAGETIVIPVLDNDSAGPLGGALTISETSSPNAVIENGTIVYTAPTDSIADTEVFTYTIVDSLGGTDTTTVTVSIQIDFPVAIDDSFNVLTGSEGNVLNVLTNDLESANTPPSTITSVESATSQGGTATLSADRSTVIYTPAADFEGEDSFTYTITDAEGDTATATVTVTVSPTGPMVEIELRVTDLDGNEINDTLRVGQEFQLRGFVRDLRDDPQGVHSAYLDVLLNDPTLVSMETIHYGEVYQDNLSGTITSGLIDEIGAEDGLTPLGPGQFHLFSVDMTALTDGTIQFSGDPADNLPANQTTVYGLNTPVANSLITFINDTITIQREAAVDFEFQITDLQGSSIDSISVGQEFMVDIFVQDLTDRGDAGGVFAAALDVLYESTLVSLSTTSPITFGPEYSANTSGDTSMPGIISNLGGLDGDTMPSGSDNGEPTIDNLLASLRVVANAAGVAEFTGQYVGSEDEPPHETILYGMSGFVDSRDMQFTNDSITILAGNDGATLQNPENPLDVNSDGVVSPIDALQVINDLNKYGARDLNTSSTSRLANAVSGTPSMVDVNGDGFISPIDALRVINHLNLASTRSRAAMSGSAVVDEDDDDSRSSQAIQIAVWSSWNEDDADEQDDADWLDELAAASASTRVAT